MGDVRSKFIAPLAQVFTLPKADDFDGFVGAYEELLSTFSDDVLAMAAKSIIASRTTRTFPLPAECNHACRDAIFGIAAEKRRPGNNRDEIRNAPLEHRYPECSDRRRELADQLFAVSGYSEEALKEDWGWTLHDWFREHQRQPDKYEIEKIRSKGMFNSQEFWGLVGSESDFVNPCAGILIRWRATAMNRLKSLIG